MIAMDREPNKPEKIDFATVAKQLISALEKRRTRRRPGSRPIVISAAAIARRFGIRPHGTHDSRRRGVRLLVERLRAGDPDHCVKPVQVLAMPGWDGGYFLPLDAADLVDYSEQRRLGGLAHLVAAGAVKRSEDLADAVGQLDLFCSGGGSRRGELKTAS